MEGERRKRKIENEEESEEEKMERFFALIKSTKDVRDLLFNKEKTDNKKVSDDDEKAKGISTWVPKFQPEDFIEYGGEFGRRNNNIVITTTPHVGSSSEKETEKEREVEVIIEKEYLKEAATTEAVGQPAEAAKEKASDLLDLNLSL
ncbi:hypothetical protein RIF29_24611 [Crotalaria pallida]|uniref:Uncharacterized protein n=1 Tax=Crotalaria pallida TaxID=3830 RepID=A0AAN9EKP2_CROPI